MSLMRLLVAGRSLNTVKNLPSPYKMKQANLLPKFVSKKADEQADVDAQTVGEGVVAVEASSRAAGSSISKAVHKLPLLRRWLAFGNRFRRLPASKRIAVQTELLLENVRVVRNDLQESARAAQPVGAGLRHRQSVLPKTSMVAGQWWLRLQMRLFAQRRRPS